MGKELAGGAVPEQRLLSDIRTLIEAAKALRERRTQRWSCFIGPSVDAFSRTC
jgi:hypothetical protein